MTPERFDKLIRTLNQRQPDLALLTDQMHKPRNIAALVRSADAFGLMNVHMVWDDQYQRPYRGTALGSQQWVDVHHHATMEVALAQLKAQGHAVYAAHMSEKAVDFRSVDYAVPAVILLGNEKQGVSAAAAQAADAHIVIPMMGMVESFNVSAAAAIILAEAQRQRAAKGMYDSRRLPEDVFRQVFFRWAHPQVARFCDEKAIAYPPLCETTGEIIDAPGWYARVRK